MNFNNLKNGGGKFAHLPVRIKESFGKAGTIAAICGKHSVINAFVSISFHLGNGYPNNISCIHRMNVANYHLAVINQTIKIQE